LLNHNKDSKQGKIMKIGILSSIFFSVSLILLAGCAKPKTEEKKCPEKKQEISSSTPVLKKDQKLKITVVGQGVAPCNGSCSPSQSYALAKRAAITDAYRLIAEKVKGVYVEGEDLIKNMMVQRSTVKTSVSATVQNATIVETTMKDGLCEVEMQVVLSHSEFTR